MVTVLSFYSALIIKTLSEDTAPADREKTRGSFIRRVKEKLKTKLSKVVKSIICRALYKCLKKVSEEDSERLELSSIEEEAESNSGSFPRIEVTAAWDERGGTSLPSYISFSEVRPASQSQAMARLTVRCAGGVLQDQSRSSDSSRDPVW